MAETSKNKIYYNDNENSVADVLTDMKKIAESTDEAIEKSKYNDAAIKKSISDVEKKQVEKNTEQDSKIVELQTEKAKLEKELKEMQEDLYQNSIRGQVSGEYIHVEDSSNCRARIGIGGNSEQETREGYNLLNANLPYTTSSSGNTIKWLGKENIPKFEVNKYYYLYGKFSDGTIFSGAHAAFVITVSSGQILNKVFGSSFQNTVDISNATNCYIYTDSTYVNKTVTEVAIYEGKENKAYEQYGTSPSPDYPSEIKTVGSNVNIFDKDNYIKSKLYINKNENKFSEASMGKSFIFDISKYNKLTISKVSSERFGVFASVDYPQKDGVGTYLQDAATNATSFSYDFAKFNYLVVFYYFSRDTLTEQEILDSIKIVEGTEVGEYSSYGQGSVKVTKCNKNLFGKYVTGIWLDTSKKLYTVISTTVGFIARVKPNTTYTIKKKNKGNRFLLVASKEPVKIGNTFSRVIFASNHDLTQYTFTTKENEYYIFLGVYNGTDENELVLAVEETQLSEGQTVKEYEQHQEQSYIMPIQQPMRSIGDIRDTFIKKENKWYERHYVQRLILNGTEGWNYDKNNNRFYFAKAGNKGSGYIMSSHYLRGDTTKQNNTCEIWSSAILFRDERFTEREDFKNMIKAKYDEGIPVYVDYVLITPTDIECTEEQSRILDELNNARTYKNVTNITTDSIAVLDLDYAKDLEILLTSKESEV